MFFSSNDNNENGCVIKHTGYWLDSDKNYFPAFAIEVFVWAVIVLTISLIKKVLCFLGEARKFLRSLNRPIIFDYFCGKTKVPPNHLKIKFFSPWILTWIALLLPPSILVGLYFWIIRYVISFWKIFHVGDLVKLRMVEALTSGFVE